MLKITDTNYELYKKLFVRIYTFTMRHYPSMAEAASSPVKEMEEWERKDMAMAKKGLKHGLSDLLGGIKTGMPEDDKLQLHKTLVEEGSPGLWQLIAITDKVQAKVLKRGKINNLDEWYVISDILSVLDAPVTDEERKKLSELSDEFEDRQRRMGR
jgi:hypothetical protein